MMQRFLVSVVCGGALTLVGCANEEQGKRTDVTESNALGIVTLETNQFEQGGDRVVELRALSESGEERASIRRRVGTISGITEEGSEPGSEVVVSIGDRVTRMVTVETGGLHLDTAAYDADMRGLLELAAVTSTLRREAHISVTATPADAETAYTASSCPASYMNTTPTANQCCLRPSPYTQQGYNGPTTIFIRPTDKATIYRFRNPNGAKCIGTTDPDTGDINETAACSGDACAYGPNVFTHAQIFTSSGPYVVVDRTYCFSTYYSSFHTTYWPNVTGSFVSTKCPVGGDPHVLAGNWDY